MRRILLLLAIVATACSGAEGEANGEDIEPAPETESQVARLENVTEATADDAARQAMAAALDEEFPLHGLVNRTTLTIRKAADPESDIIGWLRIGERVRLRAEPTRTSNCNTGWYELAPRGFACAGQGIEVGEEPPEVEDPVPPAQRDQPMPYRYFLVKDPMTPQYHQLPSRDQQRAAIAFGSRYVELLEADQDRRAERFLQGEIPGQPQRHPVIARFLRRNFFVAGTDVQVRSRRHFLRTTGGGFVKMANLDERNGSDFAGVDIDDEHPLPLRFLTRNARPRIHEERADGSHRFVRDETLEVMQRQTLFGDDYIELERFGDELHHRLERPEWDGPRYVRDYYIVTVDAIEPPFEVEENEPWVHVDLSQQSLVIYRGARPVYATLVSTGLDEHATPTGTFTIQKKMVTDTMANLGPDAGDDSYRIQDVPWTQYFEGSFALHTAFWHTRFGTQRSHGCVNLSPRDAHRVFQETWPRVPDGWHGVSTDRTGFRASRVHVTE